MRSPFTWVRIWALTNPSRVATHSLVTGTSFWLTSTNSTAGGPAAACCFVSHPDNHTVWTRRTRTNRDGFALITYAPQSRCARSPRFRARRPETPALVPHARGRDKRIRALTARG